MIFQTNTILTLFFLLLFQAPAFNVSANSVDVAAHLSGKKPPPTAQNILYSFGDRDAEITLSVANHCGGTIGLKVEFVQLAGTIAVPLGVIHERPYDEEDKKGETEDISFTRKIPEVRRETDFQLLHFAQRTKDGPWEPAGTTTLKVYPNTILEKMRSYAKVSTFIIIDSSGVLQNLLKEQKIDFIDFLSEAGKVDKIGPDSQVVAICRIEPGNDGWSGDELVEQAAIVEEYVDALILFKKRASELSQLYVKEKGDKIKAVAEIDFFADLGNNPRSQQNLLHVIDMVFERLNSEE